MSAAGVVALLITVVVLVGGTTVIELSRRRALLAMPRPAIPGPADLIAVLKSRIGWIRIGATLMTMGGPAILLMLFLEFNGPGLLWNSIRRPRILIHDPRALYSQRDHE